MASSLFSILRRLNSIVEPSRSFSEILTKNAFASRLINSRSYAAHDLYWKIIRLGKPGSSVVPELDRWVEKGSNIDAVGLPGIIRDLRKHKKYKQALEISEWMSNKGVCTFTPGDRAVQLDLIGRVHGLDSAESYFNNMSDQDKNDKIYGALFNCYVRDCLTDKALTHIQKMKEMGFLSSALPYDNLMNLYTNTRQYEKVPEVLTEMKENGFSPSNYSYKLFINSYGARSDLEGMEKCIEEIECQPDVALDWAAYTMVANFYIKADLVEKAITALKKSEGKIGQKEWFAYSHLISLYTSIGRKDDVLRIWELGKTAQKGYHNKVYVTMMRSLVKLDEFEEAETILQEWESSGNSFDMCILNTLLLGYSKKGLVEKANALLEGVVKKRKTPTPNSWCIVAEGFISKGDMKNAFECVKKALSLNVGGGEWKKKTELIKGILCWLGDEGDVESVEAFVSLLKTVIPVNREMYHTLLKANIREGNDVDGILESMKEDKIDNDEETNKILSTRPQKA